MFVLKGADRLHFIKIKKLMKTGGKNKCKNIFLWGSPSAKIYFLCISFKYYPIVTVCILLERSCKDLLSDPISLVQNLLARWRKSIKKDKIE